MNRVYHEDAAKLNAVRSAQRELEAEHLEASTKEQSGDGIQGFARDDRARPGVAGYLDD